MDINKQPLIKKKAFKLQDVLKVFLALVLFVFVLSKTDLQALIDLRNHVLFSWIIVGAGLFFIKTALKALQYYLFLKSNIHYPQMLNIVIIQNVVSNFVATGAGIASFFALSRVEQGVKISHSGTAFLLTKIGDIIAIWIFLLVSSIFVWKQIIPLQGFVIGLLLTIGIALLMVFLSILLRQKFSTQLRKWLEKLKLVNIKYVRLGLDIFDEIVQQKEVFRLRLLGLAMLYSLTFLLATMGWSYVAIHAFDVQIGLVEVVFVNVFIQLLANVPIQAYGGLGVNEGTSLYLYQFFFAGSQELASALIGIRILVYLMNLVTLLYLPAHKFFALRNNDNI